MDKVLTVIQDKIWIVNVKTNIRFQRVHRDGKYNNTMPIVAKFAYYPDRELVRQNANRFENPYGVSKQYSREILVTR